jgi:hypothetical protein
MIPVTRGTPRYFLAAARRSRDAGTALAGEIFRLTEVAFLDDKAIIKAQQTVIALDPARPMPPLSMDFGPNLFRGIMRDLIAAEASQPGGATVARAGGSVHMKETQNG